VANHTLYLFVEKPPADGILHLPGLADAQPGKAVLVGGTGEAAAVHMDEAGAHIEAGKLLATAGKAFMPVIAVPFSGELHVRPDAVGADANGRIELAAAHAERFLNYNGFGYEDPSTTYKLRWDAQASAPAYDVTVHYTPSATPAVVDLVVDGKRQPLALAPGHGATATVAVKATRNASRQPYAMRVELTPAEPFHKGDRLPAGIDGVTLTPAR
jgi:alpha-L-fucosidase